VHVGFIFSSFIQVATATILACNQANEEVEAGPDRIGQARLPNFSFYLPSANRKEKKPS
jgi:hypothetical protein